MLYFISLFISGVIHSSKTLKNGQLFSKKESSNECEALSVTVTAYLWELVTLYYLNKGSTLVERD